MHEAELYRLLREQREYVTAAATKLRREANQDLMLRGRPPEHAYGLASLLDLIALRWSNEDERLREITLDCAARILNVPAACPPSATNE